MDEAWEAVTGTSIWGVALAAVAGVAIVGGRRGRPLAKTAIKGYLGGRDWLRERLAESAEGLRDLYAEARYEHQSQGSRENPAPSEAAPKRSRRGTLVTPAEAASA